MRRKDRQITDKNKIRHIISSCTCCRLGLWDGVEVYIVPMSFGYDETDGKRTFYFHSAKVGRKIDILNKNHNVTFELDTNYRLNHGKQACDYSCRFHSIIGKGTVEFIDDMKEKKYALSKLMEQHTQKTDWSYSDKMLEAVCIFKMTVKSLDCKEHL